MHTYTTFLNIQIILTSCATSDGAKARVRFNNSPRRVLTLSQK